MIRSINFRNLVFIIIVILSISSLKSQNLFDYENSLLYAKYLFESQQFNLASEEYERVVFLKPDDTVTKLKLIQSYRFGKNYTSGIKRLNSFYNLTYENIDFANEYIKLMFLNKSWFDANQFLNNSKAFSTELRLDYQIKLELLQTNWKTAHDLIRKNPDIQIQNNLIDLTNQACNLKLKNPYLAATLSGICPGLGKIYTKDYKDGLIAFIFVSANAWQAYRGFKKNGVRSAYGWIFASLSFGFYTGNIYGAVKSAKKYNKRLNDFMLQKIENSITRNF